MAMIENISRASDQELLAREADPSTPEADWRDIVAELARRRQRSEANGPPNGPAAAAPAAGSSAQSVPRSSPAVYADGRMRRALDDLTSVLVAGETLEAYAVQRRLFALIHRRAMIAATSGRFIGMTRGFFGGFQPIDVRWQDLKDA